MSIKRIKRFSVVQTATMAAVLYFALFAVIMIPMGLIMTAIGLPEDGPFPFAGGLFFFIAPILYAIFGFIIVAIGCLLYNLVAQWIGGIEVEVIETESPSISSSELVNSPEE